MSNELEPDPNPRRLWPWFVLAALVVAAVLAFLWVSAEVRRVKGMQRFDYRPTAPPATAPNPATNTSPATLPTAVAPVVVTNQLIAGYLDALSGGDVAKGQNIFFNKPEASCGKCHRVGTQGGDNGPVLDGIGSRQTPELILESMVAPNAVITKGYETVIVRLKNGSGQSGVLRQETATNLVIHTPDDGPVTVNKGDVAERFAGISPMPADFPTLITRQDMRDLMAFLTSLTTNAPAERGIHSAAPRE